MANTHRIGPRGGRCWCGTKHTPDQLIPPAATAAAGPVLVRVAVVTCPCGMLTLDEAMHRTSAQAWTVASRHVENSRGACAGRVRMDWDHVPPALAAGLPAAPASATA